MTPETHLPDTSSTVQPDLDHDSLASLVLLDVLSQDQAERLTQAGVVDCGDLVEKLREETTGDFLLRRTDIPWERLLLAGAMANLLQVRGPGSIAAVDVVKSVMSWIDLDDSECLEMLVGLLYADRRDAHSFIALHVDEAQAQERVREGRSWLYWYPAVVFVAMAIWAITAYWSELFPPTAENFFDQAVSNFVRDLAFSSTAAYVITFGVLAIGAGIVMWVVRPTGHGRLSVFLSRLLLSDRDKVVLYETGARAPESSKKRLKSIYRGWNLMPVMMLAVGVGAYLLQLDEQFFVALVGASFVVPVAALTALQLHWEHQEFSRWNNEWADQVRMHFATHRIVTSVLRMGLIGLAFALTLFATSELSIRLAVPWSSNLAKRGEAVFLATLAATDMELEDRAMTQAWAERLVTEFQEEIASIASGARDIIADMVDVLLFSTMSGLVILTVLVFVSGMYRRGLIALIIPLLWWLSGELLPDVVGQISEGQSPVIKLSLAALAVSLVIAILSNVLGERAAQRDERECPKCFLLAGKGARYCSHCPATLVEMANR